MKIRALVLSILVTVFALPLAAQQAAGKWNASIDTPQGPFAFVFEFIVDAAGKLTGSMQNEFIGTAPITDGVLKGTDLSFTLKLNVGGDTPMTIKYTGTVKGDDLAMTSKFEGTPPGGGPAENSFTAHRAK